jgi:hypothetical protein
MGGAYVRLRARAEFNAILSWHGVFPPEAP